MNRRVAVSLVCSWILLIATTGSAHASGDLPLGGYSWIYFSYASSSYRDAGSGVFEQIGGGLKFFGSGYRQGAAMHTTTRIDLRGATLYLKWQAHGAGSYMGLLPEVVYGTAPTYSNAVPLASRSMTTHHSYQGSLVVADDTWYYTRASFGSGSVSGATALGTYDDRGGAIIDNFGQSTSVDLSSVQPILLMNDNYGGTSAFMILGEVRVEGAAPRAAFGHSPWAPAAGALVEFTNQSQGGAEESHWDFGDGSTGEDWNAVHTYATEGSYTVTLTVSDANGSDTTSREVFVRPAGCTLASLPPGVQALIDWSTFAARLDFPDSTSWDVNLLKANPMFADSSLEDGYLTVTGRQFSDYQLPIDSRQDTQTIPSGIGLQYIVGPHSIWVLTDAPLPQAYMTLFAFENTASSANMVLYPPSGFNLPWSDLEILWQSGIRVYYDFHTKFLNLPQIAMKLYERMRNGGLVSGPLSNLDVVLRTQAWMLNNSGRQVAIAYAKNQTDCLSANFRTADITNRWWPKGFGDKCGSAAWGFDATYEGLGPDWYTFSMAYGDNGTLQTIEWDGQIHAQHANYGADKVVTTSPTPLPQSIALRHTNDWSANANVFLAVMQADAITFSNRWESPQVGPPPEPIAYYLPVGWSCSEGGSAPLADFVWSPLRARPGLPVQFADATVGAPAVWSWQFGDGTTSCERSPAHSYLQGGNYAVTLATSNGCGSTTVTKHVSVNTPPQADAGVDKTESVGASCLATVTLDGTGSTDPDGGALTFSWTGAGAILEGPTPTIQLGIGNYSFSLNVTDDLGEQATDIVEVTVSDTTPPAIEQVAATPAMLWPPNHKLVPVEVAAAPVDNCSLQPACRVAEVSSSEPVNGLGDGDQEPDWLITGDMTVKLRAERSGTGNGRIYRIALQCIDPAGNASTSSVEVLVPHDH